MAESEYNIDEMCAEYLDIDNLPPLESSCTNMHVEHTIFGVPDRYDANWTKEAPDYIKEDNDNFN